MKTTPKKDKTFGSITIKRENLTYELKSSVLLSPLDQITDHAFRKICLSCGAGLTFIPLIHTDALNFRYNEYLKGKIKKKELLRWLIAYLDIGKTEKTVLQLIGSSPEKFSQSIKLLNLVKPEIKTELNSEITLIDINLGCPARREMKNHEGAALLEHPDIIKKILWAVKKETYIPFSVKMRIPKDPKQFFGILNIIKTSGASMLTVHPRTAKQAYLGVSNWLFIKRAVQEIGGIVKIIGNGDIKSRNDALRMKTETGCDGIMIGRAAIGNPLIFSEIQTPGYIPSFSEKLKKISELIEIYKKESYNHTLESKEIIAIKFHLSHATKGFIKASEYRSRIVNAKEIDELLAIIAELKKIDI